MEKAPLKIAVFDLDYTVWLPEMYELHGPPKRIKKRSSLPSSSQSSSAATVATATANNINDEYIVVDQSNTRIRLFHGASYALSQINKLRDLDDMDILAAVASRTDEPNWAQSCMDWLMVPHHDDIDKHDNKSCVENSKNKGRMLSACFDHVIIGFDDKKWHFRQIQKITNIPYDSMVFFDNEMRNIRSVQELGVKCIYTPDGMTVDAWHEALQLFDMDT